MKKKNGEKIHTHDWVTKRKILMSFLDSMKQWWWWWLWSIIISIMSVCVGGYYFSGAIFVFSPSFITPCKPSKKWNFPFSLLKSTDIGKQKDRFVKTIGNDTFIIFRWCRCCLSILILSSLFLFFSKLIHFDSDRFFSSVLPFALTHTKKNVSLFENR